MKGTGGKGFEFDCCLDARYVDSHIDIMVFRQLEFSSFKVEILQPKSVLKNRESEFDGILDDDDAEYGEDSSHTNYPELVGENTGEENSMGSKKGGWAAARGRGKGRSSCCGGGRVQSHSGRGLLLAPSPQSSSSAAAAAHSDSSKIIHLNLKGPRMPDGTRGFTMGRGKPLNSPVLGSSP